MDQQTQNQDQKPDFDFIMKQGQDQGQHKPRDKKVVVLMALCVVAVVLFIVGAFLSSRRNVQEAQDNGTATAAVEETEKNIVTQFFDLVDSGKNDEAYALLDSSSVTEEEFTTSTLPFLKTLKLRECTVANTKSSLPDDVVATGDSDPTLYILTTCHTTKDNTPLTLAFLTKEEDGKMIIIGYSIEEAL